VPCFRQRLPLLCRNPPNNDLPRSNGRLVPTLTHPGRALPRRSLAGRASARAPRAGRPDPRDLTGLLPHGAHRGRGAPHPLPGAGEAARRARSGSQATGSPARGEEPPGPPSHRPTSGDIAQAPSSGPLQPGLGGRPRTPHRNAGEAAGAAEGSFPPAAAPLTSAGPPSTKQHSAAARTRLKWRPAHVTRPTRSHWQVRTIHVPPPLQGILGLVVGPRSPTAVGGRAAPAAGHQLSAVGSFSLRGRACSGGGVGRERRLERPGIAEGRGVGALPGAGPGGDPGQSCGGACGRAPFASSTRLSW